MEMAWFGFFGGCIFSCIFLLAGICLGRQVVDKGSHDGHTDSDNNPDTTDRVVRSNIRYNSEQKTLVLKMLRHDYDKSLSPHERDVLDSMIDEFEDESDGRIPLGES